MNVVRARAGNGLILALSLLLTVGIGSVGPAQDQETSLVLISTARGPSSVAMENGARQAAEDLGVSLELRSAGLGSSVAPTCRTTTTMSEAEVPRAINSSTVSSPVVP